MLPPNLLMVSLVVFLAAAVSTAPVEEKEREEVELETTEEGDEELSEEEDDDDSKSQDKIEGILGVQQTTLASASGGSGSSVQSAGGASDATGSSAGSPGSAAAALGLSGASTGQSHAAGSDGVDSQSNGNGQKLLNGGGGGGGGGGAAGQTGVLGSFGGGFSHLDYTGIIDPSNHDFVLGLMGEADSFSPEVHVNIPGFSSGVTAALSADHSSSSGLDLSTDHVHPAHVSIDQSGLDHSSLSSGPDQSLFSSVSGSSHSAAQEAGAASSSSSHSEDHREHTGNGRQTQLTDANGVTDRPVSLSDLQTDLIAGGAESVTGHIDLTGLGLGHDVTGIYSHTDLVTAATDSTGLVSADPTGTGSPSDSSHPAVTDHTQVAGSVTEQYNPSGQGPEGAENVELEDTC